MIRYIQNKDIETGKWDACVAESQASLIYAYSWYLDVVCDDWDALVLDDYRAVMPIPFTRKAGFKLALQPLFCQQLGVFSRDTLDQKLIDEFIRAIPSRFRLVRLHMNYRNRSKAFPKTRNNYVLDLMPDIAALRKAYSSQVKRNLGKPEKNNYQLMEGISQREILELFRWQNQHKNMGLDDSAFERFGNLLNATLFKGTLYTVGLYSPVNQLCSVGVYLLDGKRLYYLLGATDDTGKEVSGLYTIMDHMIERMAGNGLTLDFEGSEIPGIAQFFRHFGAQNSPYPVLRREGFGLLNPLFRKKFP